ncbi:peptide-aspartate beta-dioxygenase [Aureococcus anophagefferens]|nr:peptide-aspartate beta-dioxygenase [Aureococcus anophagefferens]
MVGMKVDLQHEGEDGCRRVTLNEKWQKKRCGLLFKVAGLASEDELILSRQGSSKALDLAAPIGEVLRDGETYVVRQRSVVAARSAMALPAAPSGAHPPAAAAEQFYKVAIKAAPGDARSRANLAAIALKQGRFVDAARYAAAALERQEREPNVGKWWFRLGRGQHGMKRFADALNSFHSGLQAADATPGSQLRNDLAKAMETAEKALRQQWAKVAELSGRAAKEEGNRSTYRWLTESLDCDPTNVYALQQLAALALEECVGPVGRRDAKFAGLAPPEDDAAGERSDDEAPEVGAATTRRSPSSSCGS